MRAFLAVALLWAASACFAGSAAADYKKGLAAYNSSDFATAYSEWLASAKTGDKLAQHGLGFLFELRKGIPEMPEAKSLAQAVEWYQAAATQGVAAAQTNLGLMYAQGRGVKQNYDEARKLWEQAAVSGHPMAQFNLGLLYLQGLAGTPDSGRQLSISCRRRGRTCPKRSTLLERCIWPAEVWRKIAMRRYYGCRRRLRRAISTPSWRFRISTRRNSRR